jgi:hypothetical protein
MGARRRRLCWTTIGVVAVVVMVLALILRGQFERAPGNKRGDGPFPGDWPLIVPPIINPPDDRNLQHRK